jgi:hypothetical protein
MRELLAIEIFCSSCLLFEWWPYGLRALCMLYNCLDKFWIVKLFEVHLVAVGHSLVTSACGYACILLDSCKR